MPQWVYNHRGSIRIDIETCTACKLCYEELPELFADRGDGIPIVYARVIGEDTKERLFKIAEDCPSGSIILE
ncbi:ferredoxin [Thermocrinis sp.]